MRTGNPALNSKTFTDLAPTAKRMTLQGTINKSGVLLLLVVVSAFWVWRMFYNGVNVMPWMWGGLIGGLIVALVTVFKKEWAGITAPIYALLEGLFVGGISAYFEFMYEGIVVQAVGLTFGIFISLLVVYSSRLIKVTQNFRLGVAAATGGIALIYLATLGLGLFGVEVPYIHESGLIGIGFSLFVVVIASLNLVLDFDFIEHGVERGAPKYMEWYGAFGLIVTLVWLYIEILRLLAKLNKR